MTKDFGKLQAAVSMKGGKRDRKVKNIGVLPATNCMVSYVKHQYSI